MVCIRKGSYKAGLCISKFVIKYPRIIQNTLKNIKSILTEEYGYMTCGKMAKEFLLPIYFIPGIPILFQRRCQVYEEGNPKDEEKQKTFIESIQKKNFWRFEVFTDMENIINLGEYQGKIYKHDYDYLDYNFKREWKYFKTKRQQRKRKMKEFVLQNEKLRVTLLSYGAIIQKIEMPDREGNWQNIVLGFEKKEEYLDKNSAYFGAVIGRTAGRTKNGVLKIGEKEYALDKNASGKHSIHGGSYNLSQKYWKGEQEENRVRFSIESPHLENGYPGNAKIEIEYSLEDDSLKLHYRACSDQDTYFNLTNHSYFSLSGNSEEEIGEQYLTLRAEEYGEVDEDTLPIRLSSVENTSFDFRVRKQLQELFNSREEQVRIVGQGIDHPFVGNYAKLEDEKSGRCLEVRTDNQGMVIYTANWLHEIGRKNHTGIAFEAQELPCLSELKPKEYKVGRVYERETSFRFYIDFQKNK
ncbi:aldose 1-epimerase [Fusobacterium necrophorum DJ-1]|uniref:aldose epimerase family protein n=1 Tax=Fusobacterium necrophorum TaxID=859 RepID=UPI0004A8BCBD|nr:aldose epimerase family protein [Fusobacterium necrophorum]KDE65062.1 aldose 1-epimerase [Fusobacterium necrophorum DJ-1]